MTSSPGAPLLTRAFVGLAGGELAYLTAVGMTVFLVPVYATGQLGAGRAGAGLAFGSFAVSALLLRPLAGRAADRRGRLPLLVGGGLAAAAALALTPYVDTLAALVALRLLAGVGEAGVVVASFAALADLAPPSRLGEALSYNSLALYVGLGAGPPLAEWVVERWGFDAGWWVAAALALGSVAVFLLVGETSPGRPEDGPGQLLHRRSLPIAMGFLASVIAMGGFLAFATLHAGDVGLERASLPLLLYGAVVVVGRVAFARLPDRVEPLRLGATALLLMATGLAVAATWRTPSGLLVGTAVLAVGVTFSTPAFFAAIFARAAASERGAAAATASIMIDLGFGVGPVLLGAVAEEAGIPAGFLVGAAVALAGAAWTLSRAAGPPRGLRTGRRSPAPGPGRARARLPRPR